MTNGYVIYPASVGKMDLEEAKAFAAAQSELPETGYYARVESCDDERTVAEFAHGEER